MLTRNRTILFLNLMAVIPVCAPWPAASPERQIVSERNRFHQSTFRNESDKTCSLAERIHQAEARHPETHLASVVAVLLRGR
jgi:hypothetical protein